MGSPFKKGPCPSGQQQAKEDAKIVRTNMKLNVCLIYFYKRTRLSISLRNIIVLSKTRGGIVDIQRPMLIRSG